jgi:titin
LKFTAAGLNKGSTYRFKVEAQNNLGYSFFSNTLEVLAAQVPDQPEAPVTEWVQDEANPDDENTSTVKVSWVAPDNGGSPITGYRVSFRHSDLASYSEELVSCDMSASTLLTCSVPATSLIAAPYNLLWGSSVWARVVAINLYGDSLTSSEANGAVIITRPDAPINFVEDYD